MRESTKCEKLTDAKRFLKKRHGQIESGQPVAPKADRTRVRELLDDLRQHYEVTDKRTLRDVDTRRKPLLAFFADRRASALGDADFTAYAKHRQGDGRANGTVNRELSILGTALKLGKERGKVLQLPVIHLLQEADPRQGFFEMEQFEAVRTRLPDDLKLAVTIMYTYGWRLGEVMALQISQVDLKAGTLRLEPGTTKITEGRVVYLTPELTALLSAQIGRVKQLSRQLGRVLPDLFTHLSGCYQGTPRRDFRKAWDKALKTVGLAGWLRHDFRRTAVRNMERTVVPRSIAMKMTGHKTESVYRRYAIVCEQDLKEAMQRLTGTFTGTMRVSAVASKS